LGKDLLLIEVLKSKEAGRVHKIKDILNTKEQQNSIKKRYEF
jgi:hypothetical protein